MSIYADINPLDMREVMGCFGTGVTVITAHNGNEPLGFACQSFMSLSLEPALIAISRKRASTTWQRIRDIGSFTVNVLSDQQKKISRIFGRSGIDKYGSLDWNHGNAGAPRLSGASAWVDCTLEVEHDAGDHTLVVGRVHALESNLGSAPLLFHRGSYSRLQKVSV